MGLTFNAYDVLQVAPGNRAKGEKEQNCKALQISNISRVVMFHIYKC